MDLLLDETLTHHVVDCGFDKTSRDAFAIAVAVAVVRSGTVLARLARDEWIKTSIYTTRELATAEIYDYI